QRDDDVPGGAGARVGRRPHPHADRLRDHLRRTPVHGARGAGAVMATVGTQKLHVRSSTALEDAPAVFEVEALEVFYGAFRAVRDVSLNILKHQITAFVGPSGCGKTTVLRAFNRMHDVVPGTRVAGKLRYHGLDLYAPDVSATEVR